MVQEIQTTETGRGPQQSMHADQPLSRRSHLHCLLTDLTSDLADTLNPAYEFPVKVESHPGVFRRGDISLEDPLNADAEGADGAVLCAVSCGGGRKLVFG